VTGDLPRQPTSDYGCQYRAVDSPVHRLGAGAKLALGAALCAAAVLSQRPATLGALLALDLALWFAARLSLADLWRDTRYLLAQALVILGLYAARFGLPSGLWPGARVALQIALFYLPGAIFLRTTQASQLMHGLRRLLPYQLTFLVFTSLRFVPVFARELRQIAFAQRLRGARLQARDLLHPGTLGDLFHCLVIPLLVRALRTAQQAALSAEARGFGRWPERTFLDTALAAAPPGAPAGDPPAASTHPTGG